MRAVVPYRWGRGRGSGAVAAPVRTPPGPRRWRPGTADPRDGAASDQGDAAMANTDDDKRARAGAHAPRGGALGAKAGRPPGQPATNNKDARGLPRDSDRRTGQAPGDNQARTDWRSADSEPKGD